MQHLELVKVIEFYLGSVIICCIRQLCFLQIFWCKKMHLSIFVNIHKNEQLTEKQYLMQYTINKFEMFQTIISFINLIPPFLKLVYAQHIKIDAKMIKPLNTTFRYVCLNLSCLMNIFIHMPLLFDL